MTETDPSLRTLAPFLGQDTPGPVTEGRTIKQIQKELKLTDYPDIKCGIGSFNPAVLQVSEEMVCNIV